MRSLVFAALLIVTGVAFAQSPVTASLSTDRVAVGETFYIEIKAEGADVQEPDVLSAIKDTGIQTGQPNVATKMEIANINGRMSTVASKSWRYPARATKEGTITIPQIPIAVDGLALFTLPMQIRVAQAAIPSPQGNTAGGGGAITVEQLAFVESSVDKPSPYQGEAVTLSLRIYAANDYGVQIVGPRTMPMPDRQGFYSGPQQQANKMETRNGISYRVMEITIAMYPTVTGALTIQPWSWQGEVNWRDNQFMRPRAVARDFLAPAIPINVQPLPEKPADFSGAVGKYTIKGALSTEKLVQGVPVTWTLTVQGQGNPDAIGAPTIPAMSWAHISGPEIDVQQQQQNSLDATKVFRYTLTPLERGEQALPAIKFVFFAPILKNYKTETTPEQKLTIAASPDAVALVTAGGSRADERSSVEVLNEGLLPILDKPAASLRPSVTTMSLAWTAALGGLALPPLLYGAFLLWLRQRRRLTGDLRYARRHFALSRYRENMQRISGDDPGDALYHALAGYLSDMYNTVEAGLTSQDAQELLAAKGVSREVIDTVVSVLRACERARYSGGKLSPDELHALAAAAEMAVGKIQAGPRKGGRE